MKSTNAVAALAALGQQHRLAVFRLLVRAGPKGVSAGKLADVIGLAPSALSFHLARLRAAGLISAHRKGHLIIYAARREALNSLLGFLAKSCFKLARRHDAPMRGHTTPPKG
jgi:DNA-binding transcriptional ArsR family regulator